MRYLCLIYYDEKRLEAMPREESDAFWSESVAYHRAVASSKDYVFAALQPSRNAITVRERGGRLSTTGGPFAETKEQLGGFVLIRAHDLDDALGIAAKLPAARFGSVEVRPIMELRRPSLSASPQITGEEGPR